MSPGSGHPLEVALELTAEVARALAFLHGEGVVHADLSPRNVILAGGTRPVLIDFGTALSVRAGASAREVAQEEGLVAGTPAYMAPERLAGESLDARCDLYSLGCILFELLSGAPPLPPGARQSLSGAEIARRLPGLPPEIQRLLGRLLEHAPEDRLGRAIEVVLIIERALGRDPDPRLLPRPPLHRPRLQGRTAEVRALAARIEALAGQDRGGRVFVSGESGIGKTRLLNDVGRQARARQLEVVVGSAAELGLDGALGASALSLFRPLLQRLADRWSAPEAPPPAAEAVEALDVLAAYESSLRAIAGVDPTRPAALAPGPGRRRVLASLRRLIEIESQRTPLLLILDDLHLADELTLAFLESLDGEGAGAAPAPLGAVLLIGTYRSDDDGAAVSRLAALAADQRLALGRLDLDDLRAMAREMLATAHLPEGLPELLHRQSEGNPFFAAEHLRGLVEEDVLQWSSPSGWTLARPLDPTEGVADTLAPAAVARLFQRRLDFLSRRSLDLLDLTVILGREWSGARLQALARESGQPMAASSEALEELIARRILEASGPDRYRFVHDQLRAVHAANLDPARRQALHRQMAEVLDRESAAEGAPSLPGEIGLHWSLAGVPERAFPHLVLGARQAEAVYANERAVELYRQAVRQARAAPPTDPTRALRLGQTAEALGDLLFRLARHQEARQRFAEALTCAAPADTFLAARLHRKLGESHWTIHEYAPAETHLQQADTLLGPIEAQETIEQKQEWIAIHYGFLSILYYSRRVGPATLEIVQKMEPVVESAGTSLQRSLFYSSKGGELMSRRRYFFTPEAVTAGEKAVAAAERTGVIDAHGCEAYCVLGFALLWGGPEEVAAAVGWLDKGIEGARRVEDRSLLARSLNYLLIATRRQRDFVRTEQLADVLQTMAEATKLTPYLAVAEACRAWCALHRGELETARAGAQRAGALWRSTPHAYPFRWVGLFVELAVARDREQAAEIRALAGELLQPDQQRLPPALEAALERLREPAEADPKSWDEALRLAVELRFL